MVAFALHSDDSARPPRRSKGARGGGRHSPRDIYLTNSTIYTDMYVQKYMNDVQNSNSVLCQPSRTTTEEYKNTANRI